MIQRIEIFMHAYELKNFTEVANLLFLSQPTVSVQLKRLEKELGVTLFIRQGPKQVIPTKEADFFYKQMLIFRDEWSYMEEQLHNIKEKKELCIIACSNTCATNFVPKIFITLQKEFPSVIFEIRQVNSDEVMDLLEKHEAHIGFIEKPLQHDQFKRFEIFEDELVLAGKEDADLWLMREKDSGIHYYNQRFLEEQNINLPIVEVTSNGAIVAFLKEGIGKTILSKETLLKKIPYDSAFSYKRFFYCVTRPHPDTSEVNRLNDFIEQQYRLKL